MIRLFLWLLATVLATGAAGAEPLPYPKPAQGQCAGNYVESGGFCVPKSTTTNEIYKGLHP